MIKMYAWETPFRNVVKLARKKEVDQIEWASYIRGVYLSTMVFTERSTLFIAILACIYEGRAITGKVINLTSRMKFSRKYFSFYFLLKSGFGVFHGNILQRSSINSSNFLPSSSIAGS